MKPPRGLSPEEAALWRQVTATVKPLRPVSPRQERPPEAAGEAMPVGVPPPPAKRQRVSHSAKPKAAAPAPAPAQQKQSPGLDSTWDRKLIRGTLAPDFTLDLHGHTLDGAYRRLEQGLTQARMLGARLVLVVTGKPRPTEAADRGERRGAIRAKILDWLAAGPHASSIAAIRKAHRRHGGEGALYLVLRKER